MPRRRTSITPNNQHARQLRERNRVNARNYRERQRQHNETTAHQEPNQEADRETHRVRNRKNCLTFGLACNALVFNENTVDDRLAPHSCGLFNCICPFCMAITWPGEKKTFCCQNGKVNLPLPPPPPPTIQKYYDNSGDGRSFLPFCRAYNNALALASIGCNEQIQQGFNPTFTIQGKLSHRIGSLLPAAGQTPKFAQIFFYDTANEVINRLNHVSTMNEEILRTLQQCLHSINPYIKSFKSAIELCKDRDEVQIVLHANKKPQSAHPRTFNLPVASEIAAIMPGDAMGNLDVIVRCREGDGQELRRISTCHRSYDPLHYVLMFPTGCDGWKLGLSKTDKKTLTAADFYCFRLQIRANNFNIIFRLRKLLQQYAVDQWAKIEASRLEWAYKNQKTIRAEKYNGLIDAIHNADRVNVGRKIILPPTIYGSPRFYSEAFQDAMAIVRHLGKPDLFITFTCNPKWPEITEALNDGEQSCDRPDLCCRVFKLKFDSLMDDLIKKHIFGNVKAHTVTIEFQKRGLPHAHILLILDAESKPKSTEDIDGIVCAEIPDKNVNPNLHKIVTSQNVHGPCGSINPASPCMVDNRCGKAFPKLFQDSTVVTESSYPLYRRRSPDNGGMTHHIKIRGNDFEVDNSFIVPYNPILSLRYQAHINVEVVHSIQAVKYLYKYITKGQDRITVAMRDSEHFNDSDEIAMYLNARYISSSEAFWRLYGFEIHRKHPPVEKLPCHLPDQQTVLFQPEDVQQIVDRGPPITKLTAFFQTNTEDADASTILYPDFPHFFVFNKKDGKWQRRKRGPKVLNDVCRTDCIGRIPTVSLSPHQAELYHLRMLLHHKAGATSYDDLKTINGVQCATFQEACKELGLLDSDNEKDRVMEEASAVRFGPQLRQVFATLLMYCRPSDPLQFWMKHKLELCRDIMLRDNLSEISPQVENEVLLNLQSILDNEGLELHKDFQLPPAECANSDPGLPRTILEEMAYDTNNLKAKVKQDYPRLNTEQKNVFDSVVDSAVHQKGKIFALDASGGTGKTHTINLILDTVRSKSLIALATALSGIAATLLTNGRTLHSRCKIPLILHEDSTCNVSPNDAAGKLLKKAALIVIDEISMGHKHAFEAMDRSLRDICKKDVPFGGITLLLAGDWRQVLPVVRHGSRPQIVNAAFKSSHLWQHVTMLYLTKNMRVSLSGDSSEFADYLLKVGEGSQDVMKDVGPYAMRLPHDMTVPSKEDLIHYVFHNLEDNFTDLTWMSSRAIICPTNIDVDELNRIIMDSFPGEAKLYKSHDSVVEDEHQYPLEFINKLCPSGMPPHELRIKKHSIIMLLRNLDPTNGHCNGTRYIVHRLHDHVIDATVACGPHAGKRLFIPRIPLIPSDNIFPFQMKRKQFPVRPSFAITANKAQGQTLSRIGIYVQNPFFSHGQLYVAMSRVGSKENVKIYAKGKLGDEVYTDNVVYHEILRS